MSLSFLPAVMLSTVTELTPQFLQSQGIRLLMLDFDNTIVPYTTDVPTEKMEMWIHSMLASEIKLCVVSNSKRERVKIFCGKYGLDCVTHAKKPSSKGIRVCLRRYGFAANQCALAGDQIFTDVLGANCAGMRSILVKAIANHNVWLKARHVLEKPFIFLGRKTAIKL